MMDLRVLGVVGVVALACGFGGGWQVHGWKEDSTARKAEKKAEVVYVDRVHNVYIKGQEVEKRVEVIRWRTKEVIKKVNVYVPQSANAAVPNGVVRLLNAAAANEDPPAPSESDGAASAVDLVGLAATGVDNYGTCNVWREQVIGLQGYIRTVVPGS